MRNKLLLIGAAVAAATIPAAAHATATESEAFAPSTSASSGVRQVMPARVVLRSRATGRQAMAATSAQSGAE